MSLDVDEDMPCMYFGNDLAFAATRPLPSVDQVMIAGRWIARRSVVRTAANSAPPWILPSEVKAAPAKSERELAEERVQELARESMMASLALRLALDDVIQVGAAVLRLAITTNAIALASARAELACAEVRLAYSRSLSPVAIVRAVDTTPEPAPEDR